MERDDWRRIVGQVREGCQPGGLDLVFPFSITWLEEGLLDSSGFGADRLGLLVANSRALWPVLRERAPSCPHPVDEHCSELLRQVVDEVEATSRIHLTHRAIDGRFIPVQRIAEAVGFAHLSPSYLSLHPEHGPWIAFRAVALVDAPGPPPPAPRAPDPCTPCDKPCLAALELAVALPGPVRDHWQAWLAVRDACPQGRSSRYDDDQIEYHYTGRRELLPG